VNVGNTVAFCTYGYNEAIPFMLESAQVVKPHVDKMYVLLNEHNESDIEALEKAGYCVFVESWRDHFAEYKNKAIALANDYDWVLIADCDEIPTPEMAQNIRRLVEESDGATRYNIVGFDSIDITIMADGSRHEHRGTGKELLHVNVPNCYIGEVHIWLDQKINAWKGIRVPYPYKHIKYWWQVWERAVRNVFLGGGGDTWGIYQPEKCPQWFELRKITTSLGIRTWHQLKEYLKRGNIDQRLKDWIRKVREIPWHDDEYRAWIEYYRYLHPEEEI